MFNRPQVRCASYLDRVPSWYDTHTRVFYIFSLGRYHNQPIFCYGETNDLDAVEFYLKKHLPMYERVMYTPTHPRHDVDLYATTSIQNVAFDVRGFEDWNIFTCEDIEAVVQTLDLIASVDWE